MSTRILRKIFLLMVVLFVQPVGIDGKSMYATIFCFGIATSKYFKPRLNRMRAMAPKLISVLLLMCSSVVMYIIINFNLGRLVIS